MIVSTFGSCLSESTAYALEKLDVGFAYHGKILHFRTDQFIDVFLDRKYDLMPKTEMVSVADACGESSFADVNKNCISHQTEEFVKIFLDNMTAAKVLIFDNHMDIGARILSKRCQGEMRKFFLRVPHQEGEKVRTSSFITLEDSVSGFRRLFAWAAEANPDARIFFFPFPGNPFGERGKQNREQRSAAYAEAMSDVGVITFPYLEIPRKVQNYAKGPHYFLDYAYYIFARYIQYVVLTGDIPGIFNERKMGFDDLVAAAPFSLEGAPAVVG